jgi:hypothetical protein
LAQANCRFPARPFLIPSASHFALRFATDSATHSETALQTRKALKIAEFTPVYPVAICCKELGKMTLFDGHLQITDLVFFQLRNPSLILRREA